MQILLLSRTGRLLSKYWKVFSAGIVLKIFKTERVCVSLVVIHHRLVCQLFIKDWCRLSSCELKLTLFL